LDRGKKVHETGYKDNKATAILRFKGFERPDFIIQEIKRIGSQPKVGQPVVFEVKIKNAGDGRSEPASVGYRVGGSSNLKSMPLLPMGPNTIRKVRITTEPFSRAQKYRITVIVNHDHRIKEKRTDNNEKYQNFTVKK
jgi:subtilase family serine protease